MKTPATLVYIHFRDFLVIKSTTLATANMFDFDYTMTMMTAVIFFFLASNIDTIISFIYIIFIDNENDIITAVASTAATIETIINIIDAFISTIFIYYNNDTTTTAATTTPTIDTVFSNDTNINDLAPTCTVGLDCFYLSKIMTLTAKQFQVQ